MSLRGARDPWARPSRENRVAVDGFLRAAIRIPAEVWDVPLHEAGWSPAQVAEHVTLTYEVFLGQLAGDPPMRRIAGPMMQRALRWFFVPHVLFHRSLPLRAGAPREVRPAGPGVRQEALEARLRSAAEALAREVRVSSVRRINHPYFGPLSLRQAARFVAVHTEHHQRQLEAAAASSSAGEPRGM
ncbi:MAG: DinB family protein [Gemmatimonadetes bacterium]|nr:DinB family protein [Gemmatimonadota bacterium]